MQRNVTLFAAALGLLVVLGMTPISADKEGEKATLTHKELAKLLDGLGLEPKAMPNDVSRIRYERDEYFIHIDLTLKDGSVRLSAPIADVPRPAEVPGDRLLRLLELTDQRAPDGWYYDVVGRDMTYVRQFPARGVTPAALRKQLDSFHGAVKQQQADWKGLQPAMAPIKDDERAKNERAVLAGTWKAVEEVFNGTKKDAKELEKEVERVEITFSADDKPGKFRLGAATVDSVVRFEPGQDGGPARLSLYRGARRELFRGVYKLDKDVLILCLERFGLKYPSEFSGAAGTDAFLWTLKKPS
jgi:uncharacterized protein (TIGR03067 family)